MILRFTVETKTGRRETFTSSRKFEKLYQVNDFVALCEKRNEKWGYRRYSRFVLYSDSMEALLTWANLQPDMSKDTLTFVH